MADTLTALVAAGVVYDKTDFADPHLDGPTALTVTADGRVYGHLAMWGTPHIGMGRRVTPPKSPSGYKYFHQGVVSTGDGDLPVGKLTLGTGHAPVARGVDTVAAAAHYDNTGTVVAAVRAGEDEHGIWLAGRLVPGVSDERVDELRRSGVSGDWRGVAGQHELVAALAVNVPGFPIPRTEELVASGTMALVAAGIVVPPGADLPQNADEFHAVLAAAVDARVGEVVAQTLAERDRLDAAHTRRAAAAETVRAVVASARREHLAGIVAAAVDGDVSPARSDGMIALVPTAEDAALLAVDGGETVDELHLTIGYFDDAGLMPDDHSLIEAVTDELPIVDGTLEAVVSGRAVFDGEDGPVQVWLVQGDGLNAAHAAAGAPPTFDAYVPHITAAHGDALLPAAPSTVRFDRLRVSRGGEYTDYPLGEGMTAAGRRIRSAEGARRYGLSVGDLIPDAATVGRTVGNDVGRAAEGIAKALGARPAPAEAVAEAPQEPAEAEEPGNVERDVQGNELDHAPGDPTPEPEPEPEPDPESELEPEAEPEPAAEAEAAAEEGMDLAQVDTDVPARLDGAAGDRLEEDQAPETGAEGGTLVDFTDGIATYSDGTQTDGTTWTRTSTEDETSVTASLWSRIFGTD